MPGDPNECRRHAVRCLDLAADAPNDAIRTKFVTLAATWQELANQIETAIALVETAAEEESNPKTVRSGDSVVADTGC